ncbi:MAG: UDP-N-acetylmuramate dehydrogenase [Treponema sp.]|jgi:UDP-N-acetylmuramate dehydrogenase|nr:UDP-N-acetylmuramate dehydrogenase [Treponema sp.]
MADRALLQRIVEQAAAESGGTAECRFDEPMARHTTFKAGGPADLWVRPGGEGFPAFAAALLRAAAVPVFVLGGGANLVVSDRGIRGIVLDTGDWSGTAICPAGGGVPPGMQCRAGTTVDAAAGAAAAAGLSGLEFLAGMPGTVGGAVWMNARAYDRSVSGVLAETGILAAEGGPSGGAPVCRTVPFDAAAWDYKKSPFQGTAALILSARFVLERRDRGEIRREMAAHVRDRKRKGHYRFPSAGSAFKNNRDFGKPAGQIIDELGLRGFAIGGAQVAPFHGNIIINTGGARAADIRALTEEVAGRVRAATGLVLEPEILFVGEW